nr:MAG TPA: hypothetical protein [Microviridae sp.]
MIDQNTRGEGVQFNPVSAKLHSGQQFKQRPTASAPTARDP